MSAPSSLLVHDARAPRAADRGLSVRLSCQPGSNLGARSVSQLSLARVDASRSSSAKPWNTETRGRGHHSSARHPDRTLRGSTRLDYRLSLGAPKGARPVAFTHPRSTRSRGNSAAPSPLDHRRPSHVRFHAARLDSPPAPHHAAGRADPRLHSGSQLRGRLRLARRPLDAARPLPRARLRGRNVSTSASAADASRTRRRSTACLAEDGARVVRRAVEISESGRAPKNDPALFVLAMAAGLGDDATRAAALAALRQGGAHRHAPLPLAAVREGVPRLGTRRALGGGPVVHGEVSGRPRVPAAQVPGARRLGAPRCTAARAPEGAVDRARRPLPLRDARVGGGRGLERAEHRRRRSARGGAGDPSHDGGRGGARDPHLQAHARDGAHRAAHATGGLERAARRHAARRR